MRCWFTLLLITLVVTAASPLPNFEDQFTAEMDSLGIDGIVVLVVEGDEVRYLEGFGVNAEGDPIDIEATTDIGRLADIFVATVAMKQHERHMLTLGTPLVNLLPGFTLSPASYTENVTVERLLSHTAGLGTQPLPPLADLSPTDLQEIEPLHFPGERFSYCTRCYALLAHLLEQNPELPLHQTLREDIFYRLFMDNTRLQDGHILAPPADLAKFVSVQAQGGRWRGVQILTPDSVETMQSKIIESGRSPSEYMGYAYFVRIQQGLDVPEPKDDRLVTAYDLPAHRAQLTILPYFRQGILLLSDQPTPGLEPLMRLTLQAFTTWEPPAVEPPTLLARQTGTLVGIDSNFPGELVVKLTEDGSGLQIIYDGETMPARYIEDRVLGFRLRGQDARLYFPGGGRSFEAVLSVDAETAVFDRRD